MDKRGPLGYPCFSGNALRPGGLLLHLSTACNMQCRYCFSARENMPGRSVEKAGAVILTEDMALELVEARIANGVPPSIVEIGGPGEPLLNAATFGILRELHTSCPDMLLSVWTNGVLLPDRLEELVRSGASGMTLSLPAATAETAERIYDRVVYHGRSRAGRAAAEFVLQQQWNGLSNAVGAGMSVTVFVGVMGGVNDHEVPMVRQRAEEIGAARVVIVPLGR